MIFQFQAEVVIEMQDTLFQWKVKEAPVKNTL